MDGLTDTLYHVIHPLARWLHIVAMTLLVGGTMFYEVVVPVAIEDLREEQQLTIFPRARWVFRWIVWLASALLIITGVVSLLQMRHSYESTYPNTRPWIMAHVGLGLASLIVALLLTTVRRPPVHPIGWMRINMVMLLVCIFAAVVARHVRLVQDDRGRRPAAPTITDEPGSRPADPAEPSDQP